jgi:hypothetical protein
VKRVVVTDPSRPDLAQWDFEDNVWYFNVPDDASVEDINDFVAHMTENPNEDATSGFVGYMRGEPHRPWVLVDLIRHRVFGTVIDEEDAERWARKYDQIHHNGEQYGSNVWHVKLELPEEANE